MKTLVFFLFLFLFIILIPTVYAQNITEINTTCGLFDCETYLWVEGCSWQPLDKVEKKFEKTADIKGIDAKAVKGSDNLIYVWGKIEGASQNKWNISIGQCKLDPWWNSTWQYRSVLNITNNDGEILKKYHTINFTLDTQSLITAGKMSSDCSDLRVVYNNETELNLTIYNSTLDFMGNYSACNEGDNTTIYFMLQDNITGNSYDDTSYYIFYGNFTPVDIYPNSLNHVFLLYDDFNRPDSDTIGNGWVETDLDTDICSNMLCPQANNAVIARNFSVGMIYDATGWELLVDDYQNAADGYVFYGIQNETYFVSGSLFSEMGHIYYLSLEAGKIYIRKPPDIVKQATYSIYPDVWRRHDVVKYDLNGDYDSWVNGSILTWDVTDDTNTRENVTSGMAITWNRQASRTDNILFRRWINTQPTVVVEIEEEAPIPQWSDNQSSIGYTNQISYFNITWVTWINAISLVFFESNYSGTPQNYTMNNIVGNVYNYSTNIPDTGTYYWKSYANSSTNNWNVSDTWYFTISSLPPLPFISLDYCILFDKDEELPYCIFLEDIECSIECETFPPTFVFAHTNDTIAVGSAGNWYNVTFDEEESTPKLGINHTHDDLTNDTFTITNSGYYDIHYTMSFSDDAPSPDGHIVMRIVRNEVELAGSLLEEDSTKQYADFTLSNGVIIYLNAGDNLQFQFTSDDTTVSLKSHRTYGIHRDSCTAKIVRIG